MKKKNGFTLLELLVVVLIIGILASIALPQYKFAVMKSKFATLKNLTRSLGDAEERYFLAHGSYTADVDNLDISFPETPTRIVSLSNGHNKTYYFSWGLCTLIDEQYDKEPRINCDNDSINLRYGIQLTQVPSNASAYAKQYAGKHRCKPTNSSALSRKVCEKETGNTPNNGDYFY